MRTFFRWATRVAVVLTAMIVISGLTAGLVWPEFLDNLPADWIAGFTPTRASGVPMYTVFGEVTYDGEPIEDGEIRFVPLNKKLNPDFAKIIKGKYGGQVKEGEHRVEIRGMKDDRPFIPAQYNTSTDLRFSAKEGEQNFKLLSANK